MGERKGCGRRKGSLEVRTVVLERKIPQAEKRRTQSRNNMGDERRLDKTALCGGGTKTCSRR